MRLATLAIVLIATGIAAVANAATEPVAVLAGMKGRVFLVGAHAREKAPTPAEFGARLERGDRVTVGAGSSATLFFNDGNILELAAGSSITISGRVASGAVTGNEKLPREAFGAVASYVLRGSREGGLFVAPPMRSAGDPDNPEPLSPRNTDLLSGRPAFAWRATPGAVRYVVSLSGTQGEVWSRESPTNSLAWPADADAISDGEYVWDVQAMAANGPLGKDSAPPSASCPPCRRRPYAAS